MFISFLCILGDAISFLNSRVIPHNSQTLWYFYNGLEKDINGIPFPLLNTKKRLISFSDDIFLYSSLDSLLSPCTVLKIMLPSPSPAIEWHIRWHGISIDCIDIYNFY